LAVGLPAGIAQKHPYWKKEKFTQKMKFVTIPKGAEVVY
jgi:hypothetical protein